MTLAEFISSNLEPILSEWKKFAEEIPAAAGMDTEALRDHAEEILKTIAADLAEPQSEREQEAKSKGRGAEALTSADTAAEEHASGRQAEGFSISEMVSEYRALRASVLRLWTRQPAAEEGHRLDELTRFNEAIDQALAESTARYLARLDRSREVFLGVLGHDLRSPLGAVMNSAQFLMRSGGLSGPQLKATATIVSSGTRIRDMVSDLLDVTRTRLGESLPINPRPADLRMICQQVVEEASAYHPDHDVRLSVDGHLDGAWDEGRISQMLGNLVENAIQHGASDRPVTVSANEDAGSVKLSVHNEGVVIPSSSQRRIFEPLTQVEQSKMGNGRGGSLGLGLYIARVIVDAHDGSIDVQSTREAGTTFTVHLPRNAADRPHHVQRGA